MAPIVSIPGELSIMSIRIVKVASGLILRDAPMSQSAGATAVGTVPAGRVLFCYAKTVQDGVPYALVKLQNAQLAGWGRISERDGQTIYLQELPIETSEGNSLPGAIRYAAEVIAANLDRK